MLWKLYLDSVSRLDEYSLQLTKLKTQLILNFCQNYTSVSVIGNSCESKFKKKWKTSVTFLSMCVPLILYITTKTIIMETSKNCK